MKLRSLLRATVAAAALTLPASALAAAPTPIVVPGYTTYTGCQPASSAPCFVPYGPDNPMPVNDVGGGGGGGGTVSLTPGTTVGLDSGTKSIGSVGLNPGTNTIGTVNLAPGGVVGLTAGNTVGLAAGSATIGTVGLTSGTTVGLAAGANTIGSVGGNAATFTATPAVTAADYPAGQNIGGLITLTNAARANGLSGLVQAASVAFKAGVGSPFSVDIVFFNAAPTGIANNTAFSVAAGDLAKVIGVMHMTDCSSLGTPSFCQAQQQALPFIAGAASRTIYAAIVARNDVTLASTTDVTFNAQILQN
jgi:hypothetical protein